MPSNQNQTCVATTRWERELGRCCVVVGEEFPVATSSPSVLVGVMMVIMLSRSLHHQSKWGRFVPLQKASLSIPGLPFDLFRWESNSTYPERTGENGYCWQNHLHLQNRLPTTCISMSYNTEKDLMLDDSDGDGGAKGILDYLFSTLLLCFETMSARCPCYCSRVPRRQVEAWTRSTTTEQ
jgi:hypothetical protein